eukprot:7378249-Prymnesium_polylepis.2
MVSTFPAKLEGDKCEVRAAPVMHNALKNEDLRVGGAHVARCVCYDCLATCVLPVSGARDTV